MDLIQFSEQLWLIFIAFVTKKKFEALWEAGYWIELTDSKSNFFEVLRTSNIEAPIFFRQKKVLNGMSSDHTFKDSNGVTITMCDRPFVAILPKQIKEGDEIVIKGRIKENAKKFSVNFTLDCGENIAYHFGTDFTDETVKHNYKTQGQWNEPASIEQNTWTNGPGHGFVLTFFFDDNEFVVYSGDEFRNFQYRYQYQFDIRDIKSVQVWDDVDYINEIIFRYKSKKL